MLSSTNAHAAAAAAQQTTRTGLHRNQPKLIPFTIELAASCFTLIRRMYSIFQNEWFKLRQEFFGNMREANAVCVCVFGVCVPLVMIYSMDQHGNEAWPQTKRQNREHSKEYEEMERRGIGRDEHEEPESESQCIKV